MPWEMQTEAWLTTGRQSKIRMVCKAALSGIGLIRELHQMLIFLQKHKKLKKNIWQNILMERAVFTINTAQILEIFRLIMIFA